MSAGFCGFSDFETLPGRSGRFVSGKLPFHPHALPRSGGTVGLLERSRLRNTASGGAQTGDQAPTGAGTMSLGTILIIILVIALLGGFSGLGGGPFYGTGYYGGGGLGLLLLIIIILVVLGRI